MVKRIAIFVFLVFLVLATVAAVAADTGSSAHKKSALQAVYNWFGTWDKLCVSKSDRYCKACDRKCCDNCNIDCGGTCCDGCRKK
jgi:hypothetical protein